jgi:hypothetical protein
MSIEPEDRTKDMLAAAGCRAEKIPGSIRHQRRIGIFAVGPGLKRMKDVRSAPGQR